MTSCNQYPVDKSKISKSLSYTKKNPAIYNIIHCHIPVLFVNSVIEGTS